MIPELGKYVRGNDSADASAVLQDMLDNYGAVTIQTPGTYRLTAPLTLSDDQSITNPGSPRNASLKAMFSDDDIVYLDECNGARIEGVELRYNGTPATTSTAIRVGRAYQSAMSRLRFINVGQAIAQMEAVVTGGPSNLFSCTLSDIYVLGYKGFGVDLTGGDGAGNGGNTGNVISNMYIANNLSGSATSTDQSALRLKNTTETVINQLNVEHTIFAATESQGNPVRLVSCEATVFNSVHFEGVDMRRTGAGLIRMSGVGSLTGAGLNVILSFFETAAASLFEIDDDCSLFWRGGRVRSNTIDSPGSLYGVSSGTAANGAQVDVVLDEVDTLTGISSGLATEDPPIIRRWNDTVNWPA